MSSLIKYIQHFFVAKRKGHDVHSPFVFKLCEQVFYNNNVFYDFEKLNKVRHELLNNKSILEIKDLGAGSKKFVGTKRQVAEIAKSGISTRKQAELLYRLANFLQLENCIEVGGSLGLTSMYLALANPKKPVYVLEGSDALCQFAKNLFSQNQISNCKLIEGNFDQTLPDLLTQLKQVGLVYLDGNHTCEATMRYFHEILKTRNADTVIVLDDIYWSEDMTAAWKKIQTHEQVTCTIDLYHFGLVFFKQEFKEPVHLKLFIGAN
ncbi:MAG: class I SAM-dependent methyltransferase [Sphingobacteriaceae bacterium]|nr:class I SAM-dependent methyltransferase [Sphingobacteriaceae bacterium]